MARRLLPLLLLIHLTPAAEQRPASYLRHDERIAVLGDSISFQGIYQDLAKALLDALHPGNDIRFLNLARGGATAGHGPGQLAAWLRDHPEERPTLVLAMFGVNDTRWNASDDEAKHAEYRTKLGKIVDACAKADLPLILLRESHFSKGAEEDAWSAGLNRSLTRLLGIEDALAADRGIPIIDLHTAYRRALTQAWSVDPRYHFTPDVIHPTVPGHAALAVELLRALGASRPLASRDRGILAAADDGGLDITIDPALGFARSGGTLQARALIRNLRGTPRTLDVRWASPGATGQASISLDPYASSDLVCDLPVGMPPELWAAPLTVFADDGDGASAAGHALVWQREIRDAEASPFAFGAADFRVLGERTATDPCPVDQGGARFAGSTLVLTFRWQDPTPVPAEAGFANRFKQEIATPLDPNAREGQPCDAVEIFLDLRSPDDAARYTAEIDAQIPGVARIGCYFVLREGLPVPRLMASGMDADRVAFTCTDALWTVTIDLGARRSDPLGLDLRVTDTASFGLDRGPVHHLSGRRWCAPEPMSWIRLGRAGGAWQYRIGY